MGERVEYYKLLIEAKQERLRLFDEAVRPPEASGRLEVMLARIGFEIVDAVELAADRICDHLKRVENSVDELAANVRSQGR
jgi:hypothetical protein